MPNTSTSPSMISRRSLRGPNGLADSLRRSAMASCRWGRLPDARGASVLSIRRIRQAIRSASSTRARCSQGPRAREERGPAVSRVLLARLIQRLLQLRLHIRPVAMHDSPLAVEASVGFGGVPLNDGVLAPIRSLPIADLDQSTLLVHEAMEILPCPRELLAEVVAADLQELGADAVRDVEDVSEDVNEPLLAIQTQQHARGAADARFVDEKLHIGGNRARIRKLQVWSALELTTVFREGPFRLVRPSPLQVQNVIADQAVQPRAEAAPSFEGRQLGQQLDQNLLRGVFGVLRQVHHSEGNVVDPILVVPHEALECFAIAVLDSSY